MTERQKFPLRAFVNMFPLLSFAVVVVVAFAIVGVLYAVGVMT
jgi:hypothetical protein